jgi:hypothetical protein
MRSPESGGSRLAGADAAQAAIHYVAPVGEKEEYVSRAMRNVEKYLAVAPTWRLLRIDQF